MLPKLELLPIMMYFMMLPKVRRPSRLLLATSAVVVTLSALLPYSPAGHWLGFTPPPYSFLAVVAAMVVSYLCLVELVKRLFYRWVPARGIVRAPRSRPQLPYMGRP